MPETVTIDRPPVAKGPATVSTSVLALHLDCSRAYWHSSLPRSTKTQQTRKPNRICDSVALYANQFDVSRRVYLPSLSELHALGLIEWIRFPKRRQIRLSFRWRMIETAKEAMIISAVARGQRMPMLPTPQPASSHAHA